MTDVWPVTITVCVFLFLGGLFFMLYRSDQATREDRLACNRADKVWVSNQCVKVCP